MNFFTLVNLGFAVYLEHMCVVFLSFNANQNRSAIYLLHQHVRNQLADKLGGSSVCIFGYLVCVYICMYCVYICISGLDQILVCISVYTTCISVYLVHHVCNQLVDKLGGTTGRKQ